MPYSQEAAVAAVDVVADPEFRCHSDVVGIIADAAHGGLDKLQPVANVGCENRWLANSLTARTSTRWGRPQSLPPTWPYGRCTKNARIRANLIPDADPPMDVAPAGQTFAYMQAERAR